MFVNFPPAFFASSMTENLFLDTLRAYGSVVAWMPMPAFRQARAVFVEADVAARIKEVFDWLQLPHENEHAPTERYAHAKLMQIRIACLF